MSYFFHAFLFSSEAPSADRARDYLLEGALFDTRPDISMQHSAAGSFEVMSLRYDTARKPLVLRRLWGDDADANREEAAESAEIRGIDEIASSIRSAPLVLEWEVERCELDEDAWFALHLWQAWVLGPAKGWLYAPGDGIFDFELKRQIALRD